MNGQRTETPAEVDQIVGRNVLIAEYDQFIVDEGRFDRAELAVRQRLCKIDTADLRTELYTGSGGSDARNFRNERTACQGRNEGLVHARVLRASQ